MKITIVANTFTVASDIKLEDVQLLAKENPTALKIVDEAGNEKFALCYIEGGDSLQKFGMTFGGHTWEEAPRITSAFQMPEGIDNIEDAKTYVADALVKVVDYIKALEQSIPAAAKEIRDKRTALKDDITVA